MVFQQWRKAGKFELHGITADASAYKVTVDEKDLDLTKTEYELLHLLIKNVGDSFKGKRYSIMCGDTTVKWRRMSSCSYPLSAHKLPFNKHKLIETVRG